jgi:hypothetical protein
LGAYNSADIEVGLDDAEAFDLTAEDQDLDLRVLDEEGCELLVDEDESLAERVVAVDDDGDLLDEHLNGSLFRGSSILSTLVESSDERTSASDHVYFNHLNPLLEETLVPGIL